MSAYYREPNWTLQLFFLPATDRSAIVYISAPHKVKKVKAAHWGVRARAVIVGFRLFDLLYLISTWWSAPERVALTNISPHISRFDIQLFACSEEVRGGVAEKLVHHLGKKQTKKTRPLILRIAEHLGSQWARCVIIKTQLLKPTFSASSGGSWCWAVVAQWNMKLRPGVASSSSNSSLKMTSTTHAWAWQGWISSSTAWLGCYI